VAWPFVAEQVAEPAASSSDLATLLAVAARTSTEPFAAFGAIASATIRASSFEQVAEEPSAFKVLLASFASRCSALTKPQVQLLGPCSFVQSLGSWQTMACSAWQASLDLVSLLTSLASKAWFMPLTLLAFQA